MFPRFRIASRSIRLKTIGLLSLLLLSILPCLAAKAQDAPANLPTIITPVVVATGNTFQNVLASTPTNSKQRRSINIQNNNTNGDNCWVYFGLIANATKAASILLGQGGSYQRYAPFVPSDALNVTCASNSDTMYVDTQ